MLGIMRTNDRRLHESAHASLEQQFEGNLLDRSICYEEKTSFGPQMGGCFSLFFKYCLRFKVSLSVKVKFSTFYGRSMLVPGT